jgi:hypothetical protein
MDFPKTREEKSVSGSLDWLVLVTEIEMVLIRKGAFSSAKDFFCVSRGLPTRFPGYLFNFQLLRHFPTQDK